MKHRFRPRPHRTEGFTLIELLVVIAIIGILVSILLPTFNNARKRPYNIEALQCGKTIVTAQVSYMAEHNNTPAGSVAALGSSDVTEQCQNVQTAIDNALRSIDAAGSGQIAIGGSNYAFFIWSQKGTGVYYYNKDDRTSRFRLVDD